MTPGDPNPFKDAEGEKELKRAESMRLGLELSEGHEIFPFPGMNRESYAELKATDEQFPGYVTPIDTLIELFRAEGLKVMLGTYGERGDVFIVPAQSNDVKNYSVLPRDLEVNEEMDERLRQLIIANRG